MKAVLCSFPKLSSTYVTAQKFSVLEKKEISVRMTSPRGPSPAPSPPLLPRLLGTAHITPKLNTINSKHLLSHTLAEGRKVRGGLAMWFWLGVWHEVWAGAAVIQRLDRGRRVHFRGFTHMAGKGTGSLPGGLSSSPRAPCWCGPFRPLSVTH